MQSNPLVESDQGSKTKVPLHSFWRTERSDQQWDEKLKCWLELEEGSKRDWDKWIRSLEMNHLLNCFNNDREKGVAWNNLRKLFSSKQALSIFNSNECLRKKLYKAIGIHSSVTYNMCSVCTKECITSQSVNKDKARMKKREQGVHQVKKHHQHSEDLSLYLYMQQHNMFGFELYYGANNPK